MFKINSLIEKLNYHFFSYINATPASSKKMISFAIFIANKLIFIVIFLVFFLILKKRKKIYILIYKTLLSLLYSFLISLYINFKFPYPRPFVFSYGYQFINHVADNSCPSHHGLVIFTFAFSSFFWINYYYGTIIMLAGIAIAWSRIYLGIHWPLDMLTSFIVSFLSCIFTKKTFNYFK